MKVILEDGLSLNNKTGIGNYTFMLQKFLEKSNIEHEVKRKKWLESVKNSILRRFFYILWLNTFFLGYLFFQKKPIVLICSNFLLPFIKLPKVKYIPAIHDLCVYKYPECMTKTQIFYSKMAINNSIKNADLIITVSETVKEEILSEFDYPEQNISVLYNTTPFTFLNLKNTEKQKILNKYGLFSQKYILSIATFNKRKNISSLIEAFNLINKSYPDLKLVLVGGAGNYVIAKKNKNIIFTGYIKDEEIPVLYKNSLCFVLSSIYEGFGIPIIEAQNYETPVVASNIPVFREVAGEGALFCELNPKEFANKINELINNDLLRDTLTTKGLENVNKYSFDTVYNEYKKILGGI